MVTHQYDIYLINLDPTVGSEIQKIRPCVIISPDEMNQSLRTVLIAPMTSNVRSYPWRVVVKFQNKQGSVALDQIRTVDKQRLIKHLGTLPTPKIKNIKDVLQQMLIA